VSPEYTESIHLGQKQIKCIKYKSPWNHGMKKLIKANWEERKRSSSCHSSMIIHYVQYECIKSIEQELFFGCFTFYVFILPCIIFPIE